MKYKLQEQGEIFAAGSVAADAASLSLGSLHISSMNQQKSSQAARQQLASQVKEPNVEHQIDEPQINETTETASVTADAATMHSEVTTERAFHDEDAPLFTEDALQEAAPTHMSSQQIQPKLLETLNHMTSQLNMLTEVFSLLLKLQ